MQSKKNKFLVCWNLHGLQAIYDVSQSEQEASWALLKGEKYIWPYSLGMLKLQAHRQQKEAYEIYQFETDKTMAEIRHTLMFEPQPLVEWIRQNGECIYSSYVPETVKKIK